jgi:hypothetical protein
MNNDHSAEFKTDFNGFKMRAKEFLDMIPKLKTVEQLDSGYKALGISYLEADFKNDMERDQAVIVLQLVNRRIMSQSIMSLLEQIYS